VSVVGRLAVAGAAALALAASGCGDTERFAADDPRETVARLLLATIGQANGQRACGMLTARARDELAAGPAGSCRGALSKVAAVLPGEEDEPTASDRAISKLRFTAATPSDGGRRTTVRVRGRGLDLRFAMVRLSGREADAGSGLPWRVDDGVDQLFHDKPR